MCFVSQHIAYPYEGKKEGERRERGRRREMKGG
jgi:hypothetical protein